MLFALICSYLQKNRKCLQTSRKYADDVPKTLHNRPHQFVAHIMKRLDAAKQLSSTDPYNVRLGLNPSCECEDFMRHSYPCKHIIKYWINGEGILEIPDNLLLNSWIVLDSTVSADVAMHESGRCETLDLEPSPSLQSLCPSPSSGNPDSVAFNARTPLSPKNTSQPALLKSLSEIRRVCDHIKSWTYNCSDLDVANTVVKMISGVSSQCIGIKMEGSLPLRPSRSPARCTPLIRRVLRGGCLKRKRHIPLKYRRRSSGISTAQTVSTLTECVQSTEAGDFDGNR